VGGGRRKDEGKISQITPGKGKKMRGHPRTRSWVEGHRLAGASRCRECRGIASRSKEGGEATGTRSMQGFTKANSRKIVARSTKKSGSRSCCEEASGGQSGNHGEAERNLPRRKLRMLLTASRPPYAGEWHEEGMKNLQSGEGGTARSGGEGTSESAPRQWRRPTAAESTRLF